MKLDLKYNFGDEVYVVFKVEKDGMVRIFKDKVTEISMSTIYIIINFTWYSICIHYLL